MYAYDWLLSLSDEVEMVGKAGLTWSVGVYFISRYVPKAVPNHFDELAERFRLSVFGLALDVLIYDCKLSFFPHEHGSNRLCSGPHGELLPGTDCRGNFGGYVYSLCRVPLPSSRPSRVLAIQIYHNCVRCSMGRHGCSRCTWKYIDGIKSVIPWLRLRSIT